MSLLLSIYTLCKIRFRLTSSEVETPGLVAAKICAKLVL